jgi:hypothetical protein
LIVAAGRSSGLLSLGQAQLVRWILHTAPLSLDDIEAEFVAAHAAGHDVGTNFMPPREPQVRLNSDCAERTYSLIPASCRNAGSSMLHAATHVLGNQPQDIRLRG